MASSQLSSHTTAVLLKCLAQRTSVLSPLASARRVDDVEPFTMFTCSPFFSLGILRGFGLAVIVFFLFYSSNASLLPHLSSYSDETILG